MHFPSTKALVLSLLASGPLAVAAPSQAPPGAVRSVQLEQSRSDYGNAYAPSRRRRSPEALAAFAERLAARAPPTGGSPATNPANRPVTPNTPVDPNKVVDPNNPNPDRTNPDNTNPDNTNPDSTNPDNSNPEVKKPDPGNPANQPVTGNPPKEEVEMPEPETPEYDENRKKVITKGTQFKKDLQDAISSNAADTGRKEKVAGDGGLGYESEKQPMQAAEVPEINHLKDFGIALDDGKDHGWQSRQVYGANTIAALKIIASKEQKTAAVMGSWGQKVDNLKKTTWTHMFYDSLVDIFGPGADNLKALKWIDRNNVVDEAMKNEKGEIFNTVDAINEAFEILEADRESKFTIPWDSTDQKTVEVLDYLAGQTHVGRVLQFLKDYRSEFGGSKTIKNLHLYTDEHPVYRKFDIVIELTD